MGRIELKAELKRTISISAKNLEAMASLADMKGLPESQLYNKAIATFLQAEEMEGLMPVPDLAIEKLMNTAFETREEVTVNRAAALMEVTEQTARRKLNRLARMGKLTKHRDVCNQYLYYIVRGDGYVSVEESVDHEEPAPIDITGKIHEVKF